MKTKLIITIVALIVVIVFMFRWVNEVKTELKIQSDNVKALLAENTRRTTLILTYEQAKRITSLKLDSLSKALAVKPRTIEKTIEKEVIIRDTISKEVPVYHVAKGQWKIEDVDKCFSWSGTATLTDSMRIQRTGFDYHNKTTDIYFWERSKKFWFIRYGKKITKVKSSSECGESYTREIEITRH
jgi:hypothetical protein